jgi:hypothetical protein
MEKGGDGKRWRRKKEIEGRIGERQVREGLVPFAVCCCY